MPSIDFEQLDKKANQIRQTICQMTNSAGSGHPGGSLSAVEILHYLYAVQMTHDPKNPKREDRDRLIMSKGHATPVTYAVLADQGYFPAEELKQFRKFGSILQGHVHQKVPGVEFNTGSLGHGLSVANGMALAARLKKQDYKVYCIMGDGEIQEGSVWEAAMSAAHFKLGNVCAIVDYNKIQENGFVKDIKNLEPLHAKWESFGWEVAEVDGHNFEALNMAFEAFNNSSKETPFVIIAHTIKGKGVSFMENTNKWHGKAPGDEDLAKALKELNA